MGIFNQQNNVPTSGKTLGTEQHEQQEPTGIDLHLPYRPTDSVWMISGGKAVEKRVIKITTEHRSLIDASYHPSTRVTVMLADGTIKDGSEVFMSKDELIASL